MNRALIQALVAIGVYIAARPFQIYILHAIGRASREGTFCFGALQAVLRSFSRISTFSLITKRTERFGSRVDVIL